MKKIVLATILATIISLIGLRCYASEPKSLNVLLLGDSYSAGNGAGLYSGPDGCYRSQNNWAQKYIQYLRNQGFAVTFQNRACSGSITQDLSNTKSLPSKTKYLSLNGEQLNQAVVLENIKTLDPCNKADDNYADFSYKLLNLNYQQSRNQTVVKYQCQPNLRPQGDFVGPETDLVLLTIGGNNLGFQLIVENCFLYKNNDCKSNLNTASSQINKNLKSDVLTALKQIKSHGLRDDAKIVLLGYPLLSLDDNRPLSNSDDYPVSNLIRELGINGNSAQAAAVEEFNKLYPDQATFIDSVPNHFSTHEPDNRLLKRNPDRWLNDFFEPGIDPPEWYHPNQLGHQEYSTLLQPLELGNLAQMISPASSDIDLVFNIDATGSMVDEIKYIKLYIKATLDQISTKFKTARFALVTFRDYGLANGCPTIDYPFKIEKDFTYSADELKTATDNIALKAGCDSKESIYAGIMASLNLKWRPGVRKVIITISDDEPKDPEPITGYTAQTVINKAFSVDPASLYFINTGSSMINPIFEPVAAATGGQVLYSSFYNIAKTTLDYTNAEAIKPYAWLNGPYTAKIGDTIEIDGSGSYSANGQIVKYKWDFDDDKIYDLTTTEPTIKHRLNDVFDGFLTLQITDSVGKTNIANTRLIVSIDGDTIPDDEDNCPLASNHGQDDTDQDGIGDACDPEPGYEVVNYDLVTDPEPEQKPEQIENNPEAPGYSAPDRELIYQIAPPKNISQKSVCNQNLAVDNYLISDPLSPIANGNLTPNYLVPKTLSKPTTKVKPSANSGSNDGFKIIIASAIVFFSLLIANRIRKRHAAN